MTYRERMQKISLIPPDLLAATFCDELNSKIETVTLRVSAIEEQLVVIDRKLTDCCGDPGNTLRAEIAALRAEITKLKPAGG